VYDGVGGDSCRSRYRETCRGTLHGLEKAVLALASAEYRLGLMSLSLRLGKAVLALAVAEYRLGLMSLSLPRDVPGDLARA
jgi:hypothetical protein